MKQRLIMIILANVFIFFALNLQNYKDNNKNSNPNGTAERGISVQ